MIIGVARNEDQYSLKVVKHHRSRASQSHLQPIHNVDATEAEARAALLKAQLDGRVTHINRVSHRQWDATFVVGPGVAEKVGNEFTRTCVYCEADLSTKPAYAVGNGHMCAPKCEGPT